MDLLFLLESEHVDVYTVYHIIYHAHIFSLCEAATAEKKSPSKAAQSSRDPKNKPHSPSKRHGPKAARRSRDREEETSPRYSKRHGPTDAFFEMSEKHPRTDILWSALVCFYLLEPEHVDLLFLLESEHVDVYTISYIMLIFSCYIESIYCNINQNFT